MLRFVNQVGEFLAAEPAIPNPLPPLKHYIGVVPIRCALRDLRGACKNQDEKTGSMYEFHWTHGSLVNSDLVSEMSKLYSNHYGVWGPKGRRPGEPIRLSPDQIRKWLTSDSLVVWADAFGQMIGYAIAVHVQLPGHGNIAWITQLVVHKEHRQVDVGKRLLFTVWGFSDYFAWGLLSANPYAVRALEKATRRRCHPAIIAQHAKALLGLGEKQVHYLDPSRATAINAEESCVDTGFPLDHSELPAMMDSATSESKPWTLGKLRDGWEWFAFTFHDQEQFTLAESELQEMLTASDRVTKQAYARMQSQWRSHPWAKYAAKEVDLFLKACDIPPAALVLDFGCGDGRHSIEFAKRGFRVTGVDYLPESINAAKGASDDSATATSVRFHAGDCRTTEISGEFDLGICVYDVVGSYADDRENMAILVNLAKHIRPGGYAFLSVMNMELTEKMAKNWFSISSEPDRLLNLSPSSIMERSGNVFDPDFYLIDRDQRVVYRKEQFRRDDTLFEELLVRDRRYTEEEIRRMCNAAGFEVIWTRFVRSGHWEEPLDHLSESAKEILVMCRKPAQEDRQQKLFL